MAYEVSPKPAVLHLRRRIVLFGGQGSRSLFSTATTSAIENDIATSPVVSILLSKCHVAFLEEVSSLEEEAKQLLGLDLHAFRNATSLLSVEGEYQEHAVIQATTLCLLQLLHYLGEVENQSPAFEMLFDEILETTGFCAGLIPAAVVASSKSTGQFITFGVEAFRLAFWIGYRAMIQSQKHDKSHSPDATWSLVTSGLDEARIQEFVNDVNVHEAKQTLRISAVCYPDVISVSGPAHDLATLKSQFGQQHTLRFAYVHAWYHGGDNLQEVVSQIEKDIANRDIRFPSAADISKPLRSTLDASMFQAGAAGCRLDIWVVRHLLIHCVRWNIVLQNLLQVACWTLQSEKDTLVQIESFGPSSQLLLAGTKSHPNHPRLQVQDLSSFAFPRQKIDPANGQEGIAVVGMGLDLPKGKGAEELWRTISSGLSTIQEIPESRFRLLDHHTTDKPSKPRSMYARHGAFLDDIWTFDNTFFSISPREAMSMDPQQRILLHTTQAALDDAGYVPDSTPSFQRDSMGCYIGIATGDYTENLHDEIDAFYSPGTLRAFHSGRLSYVYKLSGPCMTTDTACSSSLVSIYHACRAIQNGDCTSALAGGANVICSPDMYIGLDKGHFLSSTGGCKSFDVSADGYCRAEGSVVFVLKRLSDAITENDRIHGIIRDVVVNQSGNARSITHPHSETQVNLYRDLLRRTGLPPSSISVVEAHGTGTQAGDTREIAGLQTVFGVDHSESDPLMVSSIKGNIGHCEAASGAAGLAKLLLMLRHGIIPKQAGLNNLNPKITELEEGHLKIPMKNQEWRQFKSLPRRAMLNNFGAAGSNAALLLEEVKDIQRVNRNEKCRSAYVFCLSAKTQDALLESIKKHQEFLSEDKEASLADICYTATARRQIYEYRVAAPFASIDELKIGLGRFDTSKIVQSNVGGTVIFVFSGQGSMYPGMGKELMQTSAVFKDHVLQCDNAVKSIGCPSILSLFDNRVTTQVENADEIIASQCACVALEYGLGMLLMSWGIIPSYTLGHSLGEFAALAISILWLDMFQEQETMYYLIQLHGFLPKPISVLGKPVPMLTYLQGALSIQDTMRIVASRAKLMTTHCPPKSSGMVACKLHYLKANAMLTENQKLSSLCVACKNSMADCVVSGPLDQLFLFEQVCSDRRIKSKRLDVPYGFHSTSMEPIIRPLEELGSSVKWSKPSIPIFSTVFGHLLSSDQNFPSDYFALHAIQPVLFEDCIRGLKSQGILDEAICLEIGPHPISLPMIRAMVDSKACSCIPTLQRRTPAWKSLSAALCQLITLTDNVNWRKVFDSSGARMIDLPGYPLKAKTYMIPYRERLPVVDTTDSKSSVAYTDTGLRLLPRMTPVADGHLFETTTSLLGPLISGHNVGGIAICPASLFLELALEASRAVLDVSATDVLVARDMRFVNPLVYSASNKPKRIGLFISEQNPDGTVDFRVTFIDAHGSKESLCCSGIMSIRKALDLQTRWLRDAAVVRRQSNYLLGNKNHCTSRFQRRVLYDMIFARVVKYSEEYQSLSELSVSESSLEGVGTFKVPGVSKAPHQPDVFVRWCDVLLHSAGYIANMTVGQEEIGICAHVESIEVLYDSIAFDDTFTVYCSLFEAVKGTIIADAYAVSPKGEVVGIIRGMEFKRLRLSSFQHMIQHETPPKLTAKLTAIGLQSEPVVTISSTSVNVTPLAPMENIVVRTQSVKEILNGILCEISGLPEQELDYNSHLEALGIDSMMQIEMTSKLRQKFPGTELDHNALAMCENLHALEATISSTLLSSISTPNSADSGSNASPSSKDASGTCFPQTSISDSTFSESAPTNPATVSISHSGLAPLFLFHDGSGMVNQYSRICDLDRSLHAFFDPHFSNLKEHYLSIQDMAAQYVSRISKLETPSLILGGWSFGGAVALEAAYQLSALGFKVNGLILIDSPLPTGHQPLPDAVITHLFTSPALVAEFRQSARLLGEYKPPTDISTSDFKLAILRSRDTIDTEALCGVRYDWLSRQECRDEAVAGWTRLLQREAKVFEIPGNHFEPFTAQNLAHTSSQLRSACQYIDQA